MKLFPVKIFVLVLVALSMAVPNLVSAETNSTATSHTIKAGGSNTHSTHLHGHSRYTVHVSGHEVASLEVTVYDHHGTQVGHVDEGEDSDDDKTVHVQTKEDGKYRVVVHNHDSHSITYEHHVEKASGH